MANDARGSAWYSGDHLEGALHVFERWGRSLDEVWTASAGRSDNGDPQVLVFGYSNIQILDRAGKLLLDVGDREVRAVRLVEGSGIEVCITRMGVDGLRPPRWMHCVSDADGRYLENCWLDWSPFMHSGVQLSPLPWREVEYAYFVGRVVSEASRCDVMLVELVRSLRALRGQLGGSISGASGENLADALDELCEMSPALADIGERYRAWYRQRNFVTHGVRGRDAAGRPTGEVFKMRRGKKGSEVAVEVEGQDFLELALVCRAFSNLHHDAFEALMYIGGSGSTDSLLARFPTPNSVSASERLPSDSRSGIGPE